MVTRDAAVLFGALEESTLRGGRFQIHNVSKIVHYPKKRIHIINIYDHCKQQCRNVKHAIANFSRSFQAAKAKSAKSTCKALLQKVENTKLAGKKIRYFFRRNSETHIVQIREYL